MLFLWQLVFPITPTSDASLCVAGKGKKLESSSFLNGGCLKSAETRFSLNWYVGQIGRVPKNVSAITNGACAHYVMVSNFQWKPFWLATQQDPQNDWPGWQDRVNYDKSLFAQAPLHCCRFSKDNWIFPSHLHSRQFFKGVN